MYKGAQDKQDFIHRVGSHATKGHRSNGGGIGLRGGERERALSFPEETVADLRDRRNEHIACNAALELEVSRLNRGTDEYAAVQRKITSHRLNISVLNKKLKDHAYAAHNTSRIDFLKRAMLEVLTVEAYADVIVRTEEMEAEAEGQSRSAIEMASRITRDRIYAKRAPGKKPA